MTQTAGNVLFVVQRTVELPLAIGDFDRMAELQFSDNLLVIH